MATRNTGFCFLFCSRGKNVQLQRGGLVEVSQRYVMNKIHRLTVVFWFVSFYLISFITFYFHKDGGVIFFLVANVIFPLYFCHFLAGYIAGQLEMLEEFKGNLLLNPKFIKFIAKDLSSNPKVCNIARSFLLLYIISIVNMILVFIFRQLY